MDLIKEMTDRGIDKLGRLFLEDQGIGLEFTASDGTVCKPFMDCRYKGPEAMDRVAEWFRTWHFLGGKQW